MYMCICTLSDECLVFPCQNGGTCVDLVGDYVCQCARGYTGKNCDMDIDECASSPCQNDGVCNDFINAYSCTCARGWQGNLTVTIPVNFSHVFGQRKTELSKWNFGCENGIFAYKVEDACILWALSFDFKLSGWIGTINSLNVCEGFIWRNL